MKTRSLCLIAALAGGCAGLNSPEPAQTSASCTPDNALKLGSQARAYFGGCPKESEGAFLASLERGRALAGFPPSVYPYVERMRATEKQLIAAGSDAERARLRTQLRDSEWWAVHLATSPGSYGIGQ